MGRLCSGSGVFECSTSLSGPQRPNEIRLCSREMCGFTTRKKVYDYFKMHVNCPCQHVPTRSVLKARGRSSSTAVEIHQLKVTVQAANSANIAGNDAVVVRRSKEFPPSGGRAFFDWLLNLPWKRVSVWALVGWFCYQLKDFFGIAMGTFILSFIGNSFVQGAQQTKLSKVLSSERKRRRILVVLFYSAIVSIVTIFGLLTIPNLIREGTDFVSRLQNDNIWVVVLEKTRHGLGDGLMDQLERLLMVASGDEMVGSLSSQSPHAWTLERTSYLGTVLQKMLRGYTEAAVSFTTGLLTFISRFALQVGVSLVLSFMVVWDLPRIAAGVKSLETSRIATIYAEVAPSVSIFGELFGRALQAQGFWRGKQRRSALQARIAAANTALTALGMWLLQIPGMGLLSMFVFICSFIPIAGCFISTIPIAFVALTEYGFFKLALVIGMVMGIHFVEAYLLNPAIYAAHLQLHPLLVLSVLVVAEHSLGIWGLLLAVPLTVFCLDYCIRYPACSLQEIAARELETVSSSVDFESRRDLEDRFVMPAGVNDSSLISSDS